MKPIIFWWKEDKEKNESMTRDEDKKESGSTGGSNEGCIACNSLTLEPVWNSDCYSDFEYGLHWECMLPLCVG